MTSLPLNQKEAVRRPKDDRYMDNLNTNQTKLANIIQDYLGLKVTTDILTEMIGAINQDCGVSI